MVLVEVMGSWADKHIEDLSKGMTVVAKPFGNSMEPLIYSHDEVLIAPISEGPAKIGDAILCRLKGNVLLHKVTAIDGERYQVSNNKGYVNGWTKAVYGKAICVVKGKGSYTCR